MDFKEFVQKLRLRFVAKTPEEQQQGLMGQPPLKQGEAALFVYDNPVNNNFWNKNVSFPIELGFFNDQQELIDVQSLEAEQETPVQCNNGPFQFVLETPQGYFQQFNMGKKLDELI